VRTLRVWLRRRSTPVLPARAPLALHREVGPVRAVVFDVGETLVDETRNWERVADECGVPRFTLMALIGATIARGESHRRALEWLGVEPPRSAFETDELYPDALPCLRALRDRRLRVGAVGNMAIFHEDLVRPHVDFVASSERWRVEKPAPEFFARVVAAAGHPAGEVAYVGDRVDNDIAPALAAGMVAVHLRRGPWGYLHEPPAEALRISSLDQLADLLAGSEPP
jgi:FMN phosphatase YigB (HAD superfamily)